MQEKGMSPPMTYQMLQDVETIRKGFQLGSRVSVTQLGRSTQWRDELERLSAMEVMDRTHTAAVLLKPEAYTAMLAYIEQIEAELEQAHVEALFAQRESMENWTSGEDLAMKAKESVRERQENIRRLLDGDK